MADISDKIEKIITPTKKKTCLNDKYLFKWDYIKEIYGSDYAREIFQQWGDECRKEHNKQYLKKVVPYIKKRIDEEYKALKEQYKVYLKEQYDKYR